MVPPPSTPTTAAESAAEPVAPSGFEVVGRFPGLLLANEGRIVDVSTGEAHEVLEVDQPRDVEIALPPIAIDGGFVVVTSSSQGRELRLWTADGEGRTERGAVLGTAVSGVAVRDDGRRLAWSAQASDAAAEELVEAELVGLTATIDRRTRADDGARVVGYAGDVVVLSIDDGASGGSAATWVPDTGAVTKAPQGSNGQVYGSALDAGDGRALLTDGDGPCPIVVNVDSTGTFTDPHVPACAPDPRPTGAISLWLQRQHAAVHRQSVTLTAFDLSFTWNLGGDPVDIRTVGPSHLVAVVFDEGTISVRYCRDRARSCTDIARTDTAGPLWIVRGSPATRGPAEGHEMDIDPSTVAPGGTVTVRGDEFCPFARVAISMEEPPGAPEVPIVARTTADRSGAFSATITIDRATKPGMYILNTAQEGTTEDDAFPCLHYNVGGKLTVRAAR